MTPELHTTGLELAGITLALAYKDRPYSNQNAAASAIRAYLAATDIVVMPRALSQKHYEASGNALVNGRVKIKAHHDYLTDTVHTALVAACEGEKR